MASKIKHFSFVIFALALLSLPVEAASFKERYVRIALFDNADEIIVSARGKYEIYDAKEYTFLGRGRNLRETPLSVKDGGLQFGSQFFSVQHIKVKSNKDVSVNKGKVKRRYRGDVDVLVNDKGQLLVVNVIELERYIKGVLYHEVSNRWPMEAIKAQAVAARTYALYKMKENKSELFDVRGDIYSQVYGGRSAERFRTNIAVRRTKGEILLYNGEMLPTYYHSSCGGHTESAQYLWGKDLRPLDGVICGFCNSEPHYSWRRNYQSKDIQEKLNQAGYKLGLIKEIRILKRNASDRVQDLEIIDRSGKSTAISGAKFRDIIGPNKIKSTKFQ